MTGDELDRWLATLQPHVGEWHFKNGISKLKQVTGCEHRKLQKVFIAVIAGAVPPHALSLMQLLQEFIYMAQSLLFYNEHLSSLEVAHWEFHITKSTIYNTGGWLGKHGPINHWNIPKLELMSAIHQSIIWMGALMSLPIRYSPMAFYFCLSIVFLTPQVFQHLPRRHDLLRPLDRKSVG